MKKIRINSIRVKLLVMFSTVFLILLILLVAISRLFFQSYYIDTNGSTMRQEGQRFRDNFDSEDTVALGSQLKMMTGGNYIIYDFAGGAVHIRKPAVAPKENTEHYPQIYNLTDEQIISYMALAKKDLNDGYFEVEQILDGNDTINENMNSRMIYALALNEHLLLIVTKTMGSLAEATNIYNGYTARVAVVVYAIGFVLLYFLSGYIARPIRKVNQVTKKMAALDFSESLPVKTGDELGELTDSVNTLAHELSHTIEELNQANDQLNETNAVLFDTNEQLEQELSKERSLEKMRRRFVSDVSHELKNPLSMIMGYADGLKQNIPKTKDSRDEYVEIIMDEAERMNTLVRDLLDLSAYESGTFTMERSRFCVNELIEDAVERFEHINKDKDIHIVYDKNQRYEIYADRLRISQVVVNIVSNAFKHVDVDGTIQIHVEALEMKTKVVIANTGKLIPEKELDLIWNSFYQVNTENKGNGLGLAIVKSIIELHKGTCSAYILDGNNCFEFIL